MRLRAKISKAIRHRRWSWKYVYNVLPVLAYRLGRRPALSAEARSVVAQLDRDGLAVTSVEALLGSPDAFHGLRQAIAKREDAQRDEIATARAAATERDRNFTKHFAYEIVNDDAAAPGDVFWSLANAPEIRALVDRYFGMRATFRCCNVLRSFRAGPEAFASQLWHRDRDDHLLIKMFVYVEDVDPDTGPFHYAVGSHPKQRLDPMPPHSLEGHVARSTDEQLATVIPRERWRELVGAAGTIVFADTRGYHKGGHCRAHERLIFRAMFTSTGSIGYLRKRRADTPTA